MIPLGIELGGINGNQQYKFMSYGFGHAAQANTFQVRSRTVIPNVKPDYVFISRR